MPTPNIDMLMARHARRKVEDIVDKTYRAFREIVGEYGTISADEILAIGFNLLVAITISPLEQMSRDKKTMRREIMAQLKSLMHDRNFAPAFNRELGRVIRGED